MAEQQENQNDGDELDGISEEDAKRLLDKSKDDDGKNDEDDGDPEGADQLGDGGKKALARIREERRAHRDRADKAEQALADARKKISDYEGKDKSTVDRLQQELDQAKSDLGTERGQRRRRDAAEEYAPDHATPAQIRAVTEYLKGDTDEALKVSAEKLYALIAPEPVASKQQSLPSKPKERLRGGGDPDEGSDETDPTKLAALLPRR